MRTKATIAFAALMVEVFSTCPLLAASSATAKAPPGTDNIAFGYGAGFGSSGQNENVVCIGTDSGMNSSGNADCVFIGRDAGKGASGATRRTVVNGQFCADAGEDSFVIAPSPSAPRPPIEYRSGILRENADIKIETTAADRHAFESAVADVWLSAYDGDDANDGLTPASAVRTIGRAYAVAYNGITNGTFNAANEVVVAVAEGRYDPVALWASVTNGVHYVAVGDKADTVICGSTNDVPMAAVNESEYTEANERRVTMSGFTVTCFRGRFPSTNNPGIVRGIKFVG